MDKLKENSNELNKNEKTLFLMLIFVLSGIFGFVYETIFYRIDLGYWVKRGTTIGPWIPIYGFGGILIYLINNKEKKNFFKVLLYSCLVCGGLEFLVGYVLFNFFDGLRLWDYNTEIWNFGNIGGYICLRSVLFFGVSGLFLVYIVKPLLKKLISNIDIKILNIIVGILFGIFVIDIIVNSLFGIIG